MACSSCRITTCRSSLATRLDDPVNVSQAVAHRVQEVHRRFPALGRARLVDQRLETSVASQAFERRVVLHPRRIKSEVDSSAQVTQDAVCPGRLALVDNAVGRQEGGVAQQFTRRRTQLEGLVAILESRLDVGQVTLGGLLQSNDGT